MLPFGFIPTQTQLKMWISGKHNHSEHNRVPLPSSKWLSGPTIPETSRHLTRVTLGVKQVTQNGGEERCVVRNKDQHSEVFFILKLLGG